MPTDVRMYNETIRIVEQSVFLRSCLLSAEILELPNWWIVGGAIRDTVWSALTDDYTGKTARDIDLIYFDNMNISKNVEKRIEKNLENISGVKWSVKNQARMHNFENLPPYRSVEEAISYFPETISAIALKSSQNGAPLLFNMYGLSDLFEMNLRPTPNYLKIHTPAEFIARVERKKWLTKWPSAKICTG